MAYRRTPQLTPEDRAAILVGLRADKRRKDAADHIFSSAVRDALRQGLTTRDIGDALGNSSSTVSRWSRVAAR